VLVVPEKTRTVNGPAWRFAGVRGGDTGNSGRIIIKVYMDVGVKLLDVHNNGGLETDVLEGPE
jgi:hypothetical protein